MYPQATFLVSTTLLLSQLLASVTFLVSFSAAAAVVGAGSWSTTAPVAPFALSSDSSAVTADATDSAAEESATSVSSSSPSSLGFVLLLTREVDAKSRYC